ncbi:cytochrome c551 peroxidase precursor [Variibacter gotjawalensis]|uniref:Cytochrome c551 peroxidase n=1 Tax=Variibacter gotjawalensis TaxID=1333996 RepID=A0A0S3PZ30_9BRAD|nr:cytochrome c peroxidase [Variibacter gotjawalensis]NIK47003.1 cytochrome c peroxidase [Variibacter gotjawalensis]RZS48907.1 cytochrome c peroxidase [Variibacter gotjawalensis]BAT61166.1 cytochrome c551 peroxidase precursor [Variibacter gotjawalensis]
MPRRSLILQLAAAFGLGAVTALGLALGGVLPADAKPPADALARLKARFVKPDTIPFPSNNAYSAEKRALGEKLFHETRLSGTGAMSCATCHQQALGFADGKVRSPGHDGARLQRHTPTLWNLAWGVDYFWDGRARSLEEQVIAPIESRDEMAMPIGTALATIEKDDAYVKAFAAAFPEEPRVSRENLQKALATYVRTFASPPTRFDRWIAGDANALTADEAAGFQVFAGKAKCANCHSGFAFTDEAFHDIGLPGRDRGRGAVLRLAAADHAFKTPGLREVARSAPYMHDGSLASLEDVVNHYESGIVKRKSLSRDLQRGLKLTPVERGQLIAFLKSLSNEDAPNLPASIQPAPSAVEVVAARTHTVTQDDKQFQPGRISIRKGERAWIVNNDTRTHNVRIFDPKLNFDSGAQEPGETVQIAFPVTGSFLVFCGIHPKMELRVEVEP